MSDYTVTTLGEISIDVSYGYTASSTNKELGPKFLRITDIQGGKIDWNSVPFCEINEINFEKNSLKIKDIVVARTGNSTGENAIIKEPIHSVFASYLIRFRIDEEKAIPEYIAQLMRSRRWFSFVNGVKSGSAQAGANAKTLSSFPINLPPLFKQKEIAHMLSVFDEKIEVLRKENQALEQLAQIIYKRWFVDFNFPDTEGNPYQESGGEMVESELGLIPKGWRVGKLGEVYEISIGRTPPRKESEWFSKTKTGKMWVSIKDMVNSGVYIYKSSEYLTQEAIDRFNIPIIPENTTILSFKMTVGKVCITSEKMLSNEAIAHFKIKNRFSLSTEFIYSYLQYLDFNAIGSTSSIVTAINSTIIKNLNVIMPDEKKLVNYQSLIKPIFHMIKVNSSQIQTLSETKELLLTKFI